jgi:nitrogen fixation protein
MHVKQLAQTTIIFFGVITMQTDINVIRAVLADTSVYIPYNDTNEEPIKLDYCDEEYFIGTGEETCESYSVFYNDIDLERDTFYTLTKLDTSVYMPKATLLETVINELRDDPKIVTIEDATKAINDLLEYVKYIDVSALINE